MEEIILYSTGCPKCQVLKKKLEEKGVAYTENTSVDDMLALDILSVPVLGVDGELLPFMNAINWISKQEQRR